MQKVIEDFERRAAEVDLYVAFVKKLEEANRDQTFGLRDNGLDTQDEEILPILKANAFLVLYNLVEASIRNAVERVHETLGEQNLPWEAVRKELQDLWLDQYCRMIRTPEATRSRYIGRARSMVKEALDKAPVKLNPGSMKLGKTLDADLIREVCGNHGISVSTDPIARGGTELETVKEQRNRLAHGHVFFSESGRDFIVDDLIRIKNQVMLYVREILGNFSTYIDDKQYLSS